MPRRSLHASYNYNYNYIYSVIFITLYSFWVFYTHVTNSQYFTNIDYEIASKIINGIIILLFVLSVILVYKISIYSVIDLAIIIIFAISYLYSQTGLMLFAFTYFARYVKFSSVVKAFLIATLLGILFVFITYVLNLYTGTSLDLARNDTYRYLLGYRFPTFLPNYFFHIVLCVVFLRGRNIKAYDLLIILILNFLLYVYTDTRAVFYLINLIIFCVLFFKIFRINYNTVYIGKVFRFLTIYSFLIFGLLALYLQFNYDPSVSWMNEMNSALSGRLKLGYHGIELYGVTLFGSYIEYVPILEANNNNPFFYIDSAYLQLLLTNGLLVYIIVLIGYYRLGKIVVNENQQYFGLVLIFLLLHSLTDPQLLAGEFNPFMLAIAYYGIGKIKYNVLN